MKLSEVRPSYRRRKQARDNWNTYWPVLVRLSPETLLVGKMIVFDRPTCRGASNADEGSEFKESTQHIGGKQVATCCVASRTLAFSVLENIRSMIETVPLEQAADAYARITEGKARFRMVLVVNEKEPGN
jgi:hypothetical protein